MSQLVSQKTLKRTTESLLSNLCKVDVVNVGPDTEGKIRQSEHHLFWYMAQESLKEIA